jgi:hypothetical protein
MNQNYIRRRVYNSEIPDETTEKTKGVHLGESTTPSFSDPSATRLHLQNFWKLTLSFPRSLRRLPPPGPDVPRRLDTHHTHLRRRERLDQAELRNQAHVSELR